MAEELLRSKHAFGSSANLDRVVSEGLVDAFDILFLDGDTDNPKIGWVDKNGNVVLVKDADVDTKIEESVTESKSYTDEQIAEILESMTVIEF